MDGDTEVTEILQRARDGTGKDKDGGVVNCALVFAAHYGLLDHVIDILRKCPPHVIPALLNCTASFYEPLAPLAPISLVKGVVVSKRVGYMIGTSNGLAAQFLPPATPSERVAAELARSVQTLSLIHI